MSTDLRRTLGATGEALAAVHLERLGHRLLTRNHRTRFGELDIVSIDTDVLVFTEVKSRRSSTRTGGPWDALDERKRRQVRRMATAYLHDVTDRPPTREIRFDAIGIVIDGQGRLVELRHLEGAF